MLDLDKTTWKRVKFSDAVKNVNTKSSNPASDGIDRVIAMEHLDPGKLAVRGWGTLESGTTFTRRVTPGQTLFGKRRAYQRKVAFAEFDAICSGDILTFEAIPGMMLPEFLPFVVQSDPFFERAVGTSAGSLSPRTNWRDLAKFEFDLPRLDEQKRIADLLWAVERHRNALTGRSEAAAICRTSLVESRLSSLDSSLSLAQVAEISSGVTLSPRRRELETTAPYLRVANVQRGALDLSEVKEVGATSSEVVSKGVRQGDVLVVEGHASVEEIGRAAVWDREDSPLFQNHIFRVRASEGFRPRFILEWINSASGRAYIRTVAKSTSGLYTINSTVLKLMPVPDAPQAYQDALLEELERFDYSAACEAKDRFATAELQSSLLASVFGDS
ncbi:type I restriction-modification system specificity subunit [Dietzia sp. NCCP-2495]|uniref:restriction endonuclease subunit S n=1 Tax=Dietzia sp. NCCP-2495 TaxID=2934675 RepID=UPI002230B824|nr:restriction endonuclease subunit S [Dietzia sp. NCCP-2495]GLB64270.1 type I restriction-modification system specificity subunit [Dietzia sp. NCCP-2495]